ncbi:hypothetical protein G4Z16_15545 [Streptomyces bathyalis]|uniref:Uncharacterized protein n=1 Tax=Streptomyces bathyalis TaxID=2710756 RepID=A0A7T1WU68_9ACTN|nr:hypothetical protein [Streptomyces bathyalis]QPP07570.1 hypothetical protein G4Z16_15545 [Streptomyces bathyalis]
MADLTPTPEQPGLHVSKPSRYSTASGEYACGGCGETGSTRGDDNVRAMVAHYEDHKKTCGGRQ